MTEWIQAAFLVFTLFFCVGSVWLTAGGNDRTDKS